MNDFPKPQEREWLTPHEHKFLIDMIEHHNMALIMSKDILLSTDDPDIMFLAYSIFLNQQNEISAMREMIKRRKVLESRDENYESGGPIREEKDK